MTVTPPRTEGQSPEIAERADTAETLEAAGSEVCQWLEDEQARIERELEERMRVLGERFQTAPVSESLKGAILAALMRRLERMVTDAG